MAAKIDAQVKSIVDTAYGRCEEILRRCADQLELTARYLLEHETMDAETFRKVFEQPDAPEFAGYLNQKQ